MGHLTGYGAVSGPSMLSQSPYRIFPFPIIHHLNDPLSNPPQPLQLTTLQSFVMTKLCYKHLPMPQFIQLQKNVFPVYFSAQAALVILSAATYPPAGVLSLVRSRAVWTVHVPLAINLATAGLNAMVYGPRTSELMLERQKAWGKQGEWPELYHFCV